MQALFKELITVQGSREGTRIQSRCKLVRLFGYVSLPMTTPMFGVRGRGCAGVGHWDPRSTPELCDIRLSG